jgi:hypothetical protein
MKFDPHESINHLTRASIAVIIADMFPEERINGNY